MAGSQSNPLNASTPTPVPASASQNDAIIEHVRAALRGLQFGTVTIVVQNGRVVQVERHEKTRFVYPG